MERVLLQFEQKLAKLESDLSSEASRGTGAVGASSVSAAAGQSSFLPSKVLSELKDFTQILEEQEGEWCSGRMHPSSILATYQIKQQCLLNKICQQQIMIRAGNSSSSNSSSIGSTRVENG